ncbi:MAG TPA: hypothetical protein VGE77_04850 [Nocardioides sp.]
MATRRSSRLLVALGSLLVVAGLAVLGYVAWQVWGTNIVSERRHDAVVEELEDAWAGGEDTAAVAFGEAEAILRVPAFGDDLRVDSTSTWVVDPLPANPSGGVQPPQEPDQALLTLTTCAELFATDDRYIAFAALVDVEPAG